MCDLIQQFKEIEKNLPFVVKNDNSNLGEQLEIFLKKCKTQLSNCSEVKVIFPMFYELKDWKEFDTELINNLHYLSRIDNTQFSQRLTKQLSISKTDPDNRSFTRKLLEIQNDGNNANRFNVIISSADKETEPKTENNNLVYRFRKVNCLFDNQNLEKYNYTDEVEVFKHTTFPEGEKEDYESLDIPNKDGTDTPLSKMFIPAHIHTTYLENNLKIYYIFSNCVSEYNDDALTLKATYGLGGIFVLMEDIYAEGSDEENDFIKTLENITDKIANRIVSHFQLSLITLQTTRSAISQVMARNFSHNIGSHVLVMVSKDDDVTGDESRPLLSYIQRRMEFIANITGSYPTVRETVKFFKAILSIYTKDYSNLKKLFDYISGDEKITSEDISFKNNIKDIEVSIPGGNLGFQAFYIIIENIIRNSVKHNKDSHLHNNNYKLEYSIAHEESEEYPHYYKINIIDNSGNNGKNQKINIGFLNESLKAKILNNGALRSGGWGILEMKICAAYLAGFPLEYIDNAHEKSTFIINGFETNIPPVLEITNDDKNNLIHSIYLQKPRLAAIVDTMHKENHKLGIIKITKVDEFKKNGSLHDFAIFGNITDAKNHKYHTNQRSLYIDNECDISEDLLWGEYIKQKYDETFNVYAGENGLMIDCNIKNKKIILDNHNTWWKNNSEKIKQKQCGIMYYEYLSTQSFPSWYLRSKIVNENISEKEKAQIIDAALTSVVVLDERIQKRINDKLNDNCSQNPQYSNLFIPPKQNDTDLDNPKTEPIIKELIKMINSDKLDYLLIHRSLCGNKKLNEELLKEKLNPKFIVYVSGGGIPPKLKSDNFYLPFEVLNNCLGVKYPSKFTLVNILNSLRKS